MGRFDRILTPRMQIEVNLPNYDVRKSIAAAAKRQERNRKRRDRETKAAVQAQEVFDPEPVHLGGSQQEAVARERPIVEIQL